MTMLAPGSTCKRRGSNTLETLSLETNMVFECRFGGSIQMCAAFWFEGNMVQSFLCNLLKGPGAPETSQQRAPAAAPWVEARLKVPRLP